MSAVWVQGYLVESRVQEALLTWVISPGLRGSNGCVRGVIFVYYVNACDVLYQNELLGAKESYVMDVVMKGVL